MLIAGGSAAVAIAVAGRRLMCLADNAEIGKIALELTEKSVFVAFRVISGINEGGSKSKGLLGKVNNISILFNFYSLLYKLFTLLD